MCFRLTVPITAVHLQNSERHISQACVDIIQVRWKTFTSLYSEFTQANTHQILLGSAGFRLRYDKKQFDVFFWFTVYI